MENDRESRAKHEWLLPPRRDCGPLETYSPAA